MVSDAEDSTVLLVEGRIEYELFMEHFALDKEHLSSPRVLETTNNGKEATLVSYAIEDGLQGHSDARMDFRVYDKTNEVYKAEVVLTDYTEEGKIAATETYTVQHGEVVTALYD